MGQFSIGVVSAELFFYWFQGWNLLQDGQNFKRGADVKKEEKSNIREKLVFVPFSPGTALKERSLG